MLSCKRFHKIHIMMLLFMQMSFADIDFLQKKYSWPKTIPLVTEDYESMCCNFAELREILNANIKLVIECGAWLGGSTRIILNLAPHAIVISIDHWLGSAEHLSFPYFAKKLPTLYETFLVNCWPYKERLIPMRTTILEGLNEIYDNGLQPDFIYLDASHDYESVIGQIEKIYSLFPSAIIAGDDWMWPNVQRAVNDFATLHNKKIISHANFWFFTPESEMKKFKVPWKPVGNFMDRNVLILKQLAAIGFSEAEIEFIIADISFYEANLFKSNL